MANTYAPPPFSDFVVETTRRMTSAWQKWFGDLAASVGTIPSIINRVSLSTQAASIAATNFAGTTLAAGDYRATWYARITRAGTVSSTLTVTLGWTDGGVAQSYAGAAMTGNTTTTVQSGTFMLRSGAATSITYATTYGSVGATAMQYALDLTLEKLRT